MWPFVNTYLVNHRASGRCLSWISFPSEKDVVLFTISALYWETVACWLCDSEQDCCRLYFEVLYWFSLLYTLLRFCKLSRWKMAPKGGKGGGGGRGGGGVSKCVQCLAPLELYGSDWEVSLAYVKWRKSENSITNPSYLSQNRELPFLQSISSSLWPSSFHCSSKRDSAGTLFAMASRSARNDFSTQLGFYLCTFHFLLYKRWKKDSSVVTLKNSTNELAARI